MAGSLARDGWIDLMKDEFVADPEPRSEEEEEEEEAVQPPRLG